MECFAMEVKDLWERGTDLRGQHYQVAVLIANFDIPRYEYFRVQQGAEPFWGCVDCVVPLGTHLLPASTGFYPPNTGYEAIH